MTSSPDSEVAGAQAQEGGTIKEDEPLPSRGVQHYRTMTPAEADGNPTLIVVLSDEAMLGQVLQVIPNPIPPLPRLPPSDPNTAALRKWFLNLVFQRTAPPAAVLQPNLEPNPPMPHRVIILHQLKKSEVDSILSYLSRQSMWMAALHQGNASAGHLMVVSNGGRGGEGSTVCQMAVPPFRLGNSTYV